MERVHESVWRAFQERITSPVAGVFIVFWLLFNWQFLLFIAFDSRPIFERSEIAIVLFGQWWAMFWLPVISTAIYIVGYPWLLTAAYFFAELGEVARRYLGGRLNKKKWLSPEEKEKLLEDLERARKKTVDYYKDLSEYAEQWADRSRMKGQSVDEEGESVPKEQSAESTEVDAPPPPPPPPSDSIFSNFLDSSFDEHIYRELRRDGLGREALHYLAKLRARVVTSKDDIPERSYNLLVTNGLVEVRRSGQLKITKLGEAVAARARMEPTEDR